MRALLRCRFHLAAAALAALGVSSARATDTWTSGFTKNWDDPANWSNGVPQSTDDVLFPPWLVANVNLGRNDAVNSLTFANNDFVGGGSITLGSGNVVVASGTTAGLSGAIVAPNGLNVLQGNNAFPSAQGGGTLQLDNFLGNSFVNNSSLVLNADYGTVQLVADTGVSVGGISNIGANARVQIAGTASSTIYAGNPDDNSSNLGLVNTGAGIFDLNGHAIAFGRLTGSGSVINSSSSPAQITLGGNGGTSSFNGSFSSGSVTLEKVGTGTFVLQGSSNNSGLNLVVNQGTVVLNMSPNAFNDFAVGSGGVTINGGTLVVRNHVQIPRTAVVTMNGGTFDIHGLGADIGGLDGAAGIVTNNGPVNGGLNLLNTATHTFSGIIADGTAGPLSLSTGFQPGVSQILNGHNTFTGATRIFSGGFIDAGTLEIGPSGSLGGGLVELETQPDEASLRLDNSQALPPSTVLQIDDLDTLDGPKFGVELNFQGVDYISGFTLTNGTNLTPVAQPLGVYNAQTDPQFFSGPGTIVVTPEPLSGSMCCIAMAGLLLRRRKMS